MDNKETTKVRPEDLIGYKTYAENSVSSVTGMLKIRLVVFRDKTSTHKF